MRDEKKYNKIYSNLIDRIKLSINFGLGQAWCNFEVTLPTRQTSVSQYEPISHGKVAKFVVVSDTELPILLTATTLALTVEPVTKLYGEAFSAVIGTVHYRLAMIVESEPLQLVVSCVKVLPFDYMIAI